MRISHLLQQLRDLGAKPCHEDRVLRGWSQVISYDTVHSPADNFFPQRLREGLPALEAALANLAQVQGEYAADGHTNHDSSPSPQSSPASEREGERESPSINLAEVARLLVKLADGQLTESVLLPRGGLCVSTQVGCAVGCVFCMSGRNGLIRQLGSAEIVAQVVLARQRRAVSKVVFMGMGEPAHNLDNVLEAIELLGTQGNIGHKNLVLSTVGDVRVFERLMEGLSHTVRSELVEDAKFVHVSTSSTRTDFPLAHHSKTRSKMVKPALALSLHSTNAALRAELLPNAPPLAVEELVSRAEEYARATGYPIQYQWTLLEAINDGDAELARIVQLLAGKYAVMNFIPFNEVDGLSYRRPSAERIAAMAYTLNQQGIYTRVRDSAGQEIEGACGQLRARAAKASNKLPRSLAGEV
ncbi:MAG: RNA methyltransferase [Gallionella sp.]|nr:RNA methyltransferase [Gallionella sp.]